jgi:hypothetical protein
LHASSARSSAPASSATLQPDQFLAVDSIPDNQVVDIDGINVVRGDDIQLMRANGEMRLVVTGVGTTGLLRRLNLDHIARIAAILGRTLTDQLIPWKMVASFGDPMTPLKLSIPREKLPEIYPVDLAQIIADLGARQTRQAYERPEHGPAGRGGPRKFK